VSKKFDWWAVAEILILAVWAIWVGRLFLDFSSPYLYPAGGEVPMVIETHFIWTLLPQCGSCMLWNGQLNGGNPAFAEMQGAVLHPLVIITTLALGVLSGTRILLVICLFMAGLGQWWLARVMHLGRLPRLWVGMMAIVAGDLCGRMENGGVTLVLSVASAVLILPPLVDLAINHNRRAVVWLAAAMAITWLSGQGYMQIAVIACWLPAALLLGDQREHPFWLDLLAAVGLSFLFIGVFAVPMLHFLPNFNKYTDNSLSSLQPLVYIPLNLLIQDNSAYMANIFGTQGTPYIYFDYVGWVPILLALAVLRFGWDKNRRLMGFFYLGMGLLFVLNSAEVLHFLVKFFPILGNLRNINVSVALVVPLLLALAAWGLDWLMHLEWPKIILGVSKGGREIIEKLPVSLLILVPFLAYAIYSAYQAGHHSLYQYSVAFPDGSLQAQELDHAEWVSPAYGDYIWLPQLLAQGVKLTNAPRPWQWAGRVFPLPYLETARNAESDLSNQKLGPFEDITVFVHPENEYAVVTADGNSFPCVAQAYGGNIDVNCNAPQSGTLIVNENSWDSWYASVDGQVTPLLSGQWLSVAAPAGQHTYSFRYRPWDVWVGLLVTVIGIILAAVWWRRIGPTQAVPSDLATSARPG
ncbi:MAG TPA: hypothetical protein VMC62_01995, partial [Longilinea sp.]|nr:hypothetical protein [Longilinea sp.]